MKDDKFEAYSSLLDGELEAAEEKRVLGELAEDGEGRSRLARYSLISEALRNEPVHAGALCVADAVRERLQKEPVILAPRPAAKPRRPAWWQPAAGLAIAASVALVAVGLMPRLLSESPEAGSSPVQVVGNPNVQPTLVSSSRTQWSDSRPEQQDRLNRYLADHNEFAPQGSAPGMAAYATFVSYDSEE